MIFSMMPQLEQFYLESLMALQKHGITAQALCLHSTMEQICPPKFEQLFRAGLQNV
jgi:hypothetical protein